MFKFMFHFPHQLIYNINELCVKMDLPKVGYFGKGWRLEVQLLLVFMFDL